MGISDPMFTGDLQRRVAELERELRNITSGRRLEDASIGARGIVVRGGGSITIDGGTLKLIDENGVDVAYFGDTDIGGVSRGWAFRFDSGDLAFSLGGPPGDQFWALWDEHNNYLVTNDAVTGYGLARPYLNYRMVPGFEAQSIGEGSASMWPSTASTSPVKIMYGINPIWHPRISVGVTTTTTGGGNVAWRLDVNGETAASGTGTGTQTVSVPDWGTNVEPGQAVGIDLYANCTGGATRAWIQCDRLYGTQS